MEKTRVKKVVIYCVQDDKLLVFRHVDYPYEEVGLQVPAGTVEPGEDTLDAALRELCEETGHNGFKIEAFLGQADYDISPYRFEVQERYFYKATPTAPLPDRWASQEQHDGQSPITRLECFWVPIKSGHVLQAGQGAMIGKMFA